MPHGRRMGDGWETDLASQGHLGPAKDNSNQLAKSARQGRHRDVKPLSPKMRGWPGPVTLGGQVPSDEEDCHVLHGQDQGHAQRSRGHGRQGHRQGRRLRRPAHREQVPEAGRHRPGQGAGRVRHPAAGSGQPSAVLARGGG
ncbi:hypothetical protein SGPA1_41000 [Streptomyces misionensis JCM 4497]